MVDENVYVMEFIRYIHLNPVRARLEDNPIDYHWSSYKAYLKLVGCSFLTINDLLLRFQNSWKEAIKNYEDYILKGIGVKSVLNFKKEEFDIVIEDEVFTEELIQGFIIDPKKTFS